MSDKTFAELLNEQVGHEFSAHQQYVAIAVYFDGETLPRLAGFYYRQALEERNHAMMIVQYLAAMMHPGTPNDVAPRGYNETEVADGLPSSPLELRPLAAGFGLEPDA